MYYCFLDEDNLNLYNDPLQIQRQYAERIGALCTGSIAHRTISADAKNIETLAGKDIMLRCTCDNVNEGIRLLETYGGVVIETLNDIEKIENWYAFYPAKRSICEIELSKIIAGYLPEPFSLEKFVFLKSKKKGFSAVLSISRILQKDEQIIDFLIEKGNMYGNQFLISEYLPMKADSLGVRESRHVVLNNVLKNSSRMLHSVKHTVPKSHIVMAQKIISEISKLELYPGNYVLDLGEFVREDSSTYIDIIELNPISFSMCYVNNSIFETEIPEIRGHRSNLGMGYEYCYDAVQRPDEYFEVRAANAQYSYLPEEQYRLL